MQFGIFDYIDDRGEVLQKTYEDRLALLQAAEAAGFYGYHLTEHHATPLSMTPSPSIFLAAAARETRRIRLGTLLYPAAALPPAAAAGRALHARSPERRPARHRRGPRHLADGVRRLRRGFRAIGQRLRTRLQRALPGLHPRSTRLHVRPLHLQGRAGGDPPAAASAPAVLVRIARRSRPGVRRTPRHARGHARAGREGCEDACDLPRAVGDPWRGPQARAPRSRPRTAA